MITTSSIQLVEKAALLSLKWHGDQKRKDGKPFIIHPIMVASIVAQFGFSDETIAAAYCHDVLEDTNCHEDEIREVLGLNVLSIVKAVTYDPTLVENGDWEAKKNQYVESVRNGPEEAKAVCCADKIHNAFSILNEYKIEGPALWDKYTKGKEGKLKFEKDVLAMLKQSWDHPMLSLYEQLIAEEEKL